MLRLRSADRQCRLRQHGANPERRGVIARGEGQVRAHLPLALRYAMSGTAWEVMLGRSDLPRPLFPGDRHRDGGTLFSLSYQAQVVGGTLAALLFRWMAKDD